MAIASLAASELIKNVTASAPAQVASGPNAAARGRSSAASEARVQSRDRVSGFASNEIVFAVVGHVGSGTSTIAGMLAESLKGERDRGAFDVVSLKASERIVNWAKQADLQTPADSESIENVTTLQDLGDEMRRAHADPAAVAVALVREIREERARRVGCRTEPGKAVEPDGRRRAYVVESIRHPAEVELLRSVYQDAFVLIGVVCTEEVRIARLQNKYRDGGRENVLRFMKRDAQDADPLGQNVRGAFKLSDAFINNTEERYSDDGRANLDWDIADQLSRLVDIITRDQIRRPTTAEQAMYAAHGAALRSACLSRQVGAAVVDASGSIVATGTNEVPCPGGGTYPISGHGSGPQDERCAFRAGPNLSPGCASTREQERIIAELADLIADTDGMWTVDRAKLAEVVSRSAPAETVGKLTEAIARAPSVCTVNRTALVDRLWTSPVGSLLEFSRAVHAEMDAVLTAGRHGRPLVGAQVFVTVFPCHYCARHLVAAGVDEVRYIEAYPKSRARELHDDAITETARGRQTQGRPSDPSTRQTRRKMLLGPFTGVAPRLYAKAFEKDRALKDDRTGDLKVGPPPRSGAWDLSRVSYTHIEAELVK
jgi:deoxycytidylate deaminase